MGGRPAVGTGEGEALRADLVGAKRSARRVDWTIVEDVTEQHSESGSDRNGGGGGGEGEGVRSWFQRSALGLVLLGGRLDALTAILHPSDDNGAAATATVATA